MQAAVGCAQLKKLPDFVERRRYNFNHLYEGLKDLQDKIILPKACENSNPSWFGFLITCKNDVERKEIIPKLEGAGIQTRMLFSGNILRHPCFNEMRKTGEGYRVVGELTNTDEIMNKTFWIGVYPGMTDEKIDYMIKIIHESLK